MKKVVLDTSFIISCVRNKIDFFVELENFGFLVVIPEEVIRELKGISGKGRGNLKVEAGIGLKVLETHYFEKVRLGARNVDNGILKFARENDFFIATLDAEIKKAAKGRILVIRDKKNIEMA